MPEVEDFKYLATQAMAEYLADAPDLDLDGIYFPSVQRRSKGANVALLYKASRVELLDLPKGTESRASQYFGHPDEDEPPVWNVYEETPNPAEVVMDTPGYPFLDGLDFETWVDEDADQRDKPCGSI